VKLPVKVTPAAPGDALVGWLGNALKVRVKAAPERGIPVFIVGATG
jgi:uncharacterized protein YggU (UPF0235/DUF167 family)